MVKVCSNAFIFSPNQTNKILVKANQSINNYCTSRIMHSATHNGDTEKHEIYDVELSDILKNNPILMCDLGMVWFPFPWMWM